MNSVEREVMETRIARDGIYIDVESFERHLAPARSVALLRENDDLLILPILGKDGGGFYVKQVNARGDRAIHIADFLRSNGIDETIERRVAAAWDASVAGYSIRGFFAQERTALARK